MNDRTLQRVEYKSNSPVHLFSVAYMPSFRHDSFLDSFDFYQTWEFDKTIMIEVVFEAEMVAVPSKVVPLIHIYAVLIVWYDLKNGNRGVNERVYMYIGHFYKGKGVRRKYKIHSEISLMLIGEWSSHASFLLIERSSEP